MSKFLFLVCPMKSYYAKLTWSWKKSVGNWTCANKYIDKANEPWDKLDRYKLNAGRYRSGCTLLYRWSQALIAAVSVSMVRSMLQIIPIRNPMYVLSPLFTFTRFPPSY